jgi:hypothetical protein
MRLIHELLQYTLLEFLVNLTQQTPDAHLPDAITDPLKYRPGFAPRAHSRTKRLGRFAFFLIHVRVVFNFFDRHRLRAAIPHLPKFRGPGLHLELLCDPSRKSRHFSSPHLCHIA